MSVVNRMLQDIDRRNAGAPVVVGGPFTGTRSVPGAQRPKAGRSWHPMSLAPALGLFGLMVAATVWFVVQRHRTAPVPPMLVRPVAASEVSPMLLPLEIRVQEVALVAAPRLEGARGRVDRDKRDRAAAPSEPFRLSLQLAAPPAGIAVPVKAAAVAPSSPRRVEAPVRQVAAEETIATARMLWNAGGQAEALATLREGLAAGEARKDAQSVNLLAREMARLEISANRPRGALEVLKRAQPQAGEDAEALALRGNAEQRLGMHGEAAQSYVAALRLSPGEGRWMVGAAISLAAEGKREEAQAWADKARERGAVTPPIAAYLQEIGIGARP